jgi:hypothetical protein
MRYSRLLSFSIPLGILLSGCSLYTKSVYTLGSRPTTTVKLYYAPLPNYVKYNQLESPPLKTSVAKTAKTAPSCSKKKKSFIVVAVVKNADNTGSMSYVIVDDNAAPGTWHSNGNVSNENTNFTLFNPLMFGDSFSVDPITSGPKCGEVRISGRTGVDTKTQSWVSRQQHTSPHDDDVKWDQQ